jgi:hypothetical protein
MQNDSSQVVVTRFFEALYDLKRRRAIRGKQTFTRRFNINNRNFWSIEQGRSGAFQLVWLTYLVAGYGVSADWLLTGRGEMYAEEPPVRVGYKPREKKKEA